MNFDKPENEGKVVPIFKAREERIKKADKQGDWRTAEKEEMELLLYRLKNDQHYEETFKKRVQKRIANLEAALNKPYPAEQAALYRGYRAQVAELREALTGYARTFAADIEKFETLIEESGQALLRLQTEARGNDELLQTVKELQKRLEEQRGIMEERNDTVGSAQSQFLLAKLAKAVEEYQNRKL